MKKLIVFIIGILTWVSAAAEVEIFVSGDFFTTGEMNSPSVVISKPTSDLGVNGFAPVNHKSGFSVGVAKSILPRLSIGLQYSYNRASAVADTDITFRWSLSESTYTRTNLSEVLANKWENHTVLAFAKYDWLSVGRFSLYSKLGGGLRFSKSNVWLNRNYAFDVKYSVDKTSSTHFAYQITPLGVDFKLFPFFSIFAEGGYGYVGCLSVGLKARF